ncbi:MAG: heme-binding protein [Candidatus Nanopelagicales bacterium]
MPDLVASALQITTEGARAVLAAAALEAGPSPVSIAVVDAGGHLVALERLSGAAPHTVHSATTKAACAASMRKETGLAGAPIDVPTGLGIALAAGPERWTPLPGGFPLVVDGQCIGAIGVAGAPHDVDERVARAGAKALVRE